MALKANAKASSREPAPAGTHVARCVQVIDYGHQFNKKWDNWAHKILVGWELPNCKFKAKWEEDGKEVEEERTHMVWNQYTLSLSDRSWLYKDLQSWRGVPWTDEAIKSWEAKKLLDVPCMLNIIHQDGYANVSAITQVPDGMAVPDRVNELMYFEIGEDMDMKVFENLGPKSQERIKASREWQQIAGEYEEEIVKDAQAAKPDDQDIPF